jgi:hypothetical protein
MAVEIEIKAMPTGAMVHLIFREGRGSPLILSSRGVMFGDQYETKLKAAVQELRDLLVDVTMKRPARENEDG